MFVTRIIAVETDEQIRETADLASQIWRQHFIPIIGKDQVEYMLTKFQSYSAIKAQIEQDGYEYFQCLANGVLAGYAGIHEKDHALFLSKLYIHPRTVPRIPSCNRSIEIPRCSLQDPWS